MKEKGRKKKVSDFINGIFWGVIIGGCAFLIIVLIILRAPNINEIEASKLADKVCELKYGTEAIYWNGEVLRCSYEKENTNYHEVKFGGEQKWQ